MRGRGLHGNSTTNGRVRTEKKKKKLMRPAAGVPPSGMMTCFRGNREEFYGEVLLLDGRKMTLTSEQGIKRSSKAAAILQRVFSLLNLEEEEFFGLRFCDVTQRTFWLDPSRTLLQHRQLAGPPYIFYFGVRFYPEDPSELQEETTRDQFYLQVRQDVRRGVLLSPAHLRPRLSALMLQAEGGAVQEDTSPNKQEVQLILQTLRGVSRPQARSLFLSLCSELQMYGVTLFTAYGENQAEYFLGPMPVGVAVFRNKELVGKYFWKRITKLTFRDKTFQLRVGSRNGSETTFFFLLLDRCDCKRLWKCCVEHHTFSTARCPSSRPNVGLLTNRTVNNKTTTADVCMGPRQHDFSLPANHTGGVARELITKQTAPPVVQRSEGGVQVDQAKPGAPWETSGSVSGMFNPTFSPNTKEGPQRRSRSLDGDRPIRSQRSRSHGNTSSGSESERVESNSGRRRRRIRSGKQLLEADGVIDRRTEEIPYKEVRASGDPIRTRRSPRGRRHHRWASASDLQGASVCDVIRNSSKTEMVPPLPVTTATDVSYPSPTDAR